MDSEGDADYASFYGLVSESGGWFFCGMLWITLFYWLMRDTSWSKYYFWNDTGFVQVDSSVF